MPLLSPRSNDKSSSATQTWFKRVRENLEMMFDSRAILPSAPAASPLKFILVDASTHSGSSQTFSVLAHAVIFCAAFFLLAKTPLGPPGLRLNPLPPQHGPLSFIPPLDPQSVGRPSLGRKGGSGDDASPYANVASQAACLYCPEPPYTEEARKAKLQGTVLLQVLVGADGVAKRIRVQKGLGMGMDENAVEKVKGWRFTPARDAARRPIAVWITIETHFFLF